MELEKVVFYVFNETWTFTQMRDTLGKIINTLRNNAIKVHEKYPNAFGIKAPDGSSTSTYQKIMNDLGDLSQEIYGWISTLDTADKVIDLLDPVKLLEKAKDYLLDIEDTSEDIDKLSIKQRHPINLENIKKKYNEYLNKAKNIYNQIPQPIS